jgi:large subunit ribosomal protein L30
MGNSQNSKLRVSLVRSLVGVRREHRASVRGLGLRRLNHTVELSDTPAIRGMLRKVCYLVRCDEESPGK